MATFPLQYGQPIYIYVTSSATSPSLSGWIGGVTSPVGGQCSLSSAGNNQTSTLTSGLPDEFVILDYQGQNPGGVVSYEDSITLYNKTQQAFWSSGNGCIFTYPAGAANNMMVSLIPSSGTAGSIQAPIYPQNASGINGSIFRAKGSIYPTMMLNSSQKPAVMFSSDRGDTTFMFSLVEAPPPPPGPSPTPLVPAPQLVGIQSQTAKTYLTVCGECNSIPGFSVDVHAQGISQADGSIWQLINAGPDIVALKNTLTNTYLTACQGCNGAASGSWSVDVSGTSATQSAGTLWKVIVENGQLSALMSTSSSTYLGLCEGCNAIPSGYSAILSTDDPTQIGGLWSIQSLSPTPSPDPVVPIPPITPLVPGIPAAASKPQWILWVGVGLWLVGSLLTLLLPERFVVLRMFFILMALVGIGAIFYMSY